GIACQLWATECDGRNALASASAPSRFAPEDTLPEDSDVFDRSRWSVTPSYGAFDGIDWTAGRFGEREIVATVLGVPEPREGVLKLKSPFTLCKQWPGERRHDRHRHPDADGDDNRQEACHERDGVASAEGGESRLRCCPSERCHDD